MTMLSHALSRARRSIAVRLSLMLITVFVLVLTGVGVHLYGILGSEFAMRVRTELHGKVELVQHALGELPSLRDIAARRQRFDDILLGQHHLRLAILDAEGVVLYQSAEFGALDSPLLAWIREQILAGREGDSEYRGKHEFLARTAKGRVGRTAPPVWIAIATDVHDHRDLLAAHGEAMLISLSLGAVLAALGGLWIIRTGLAPVTRVAIAAERISGSHLLDSRIQIEDVPLELVRLVEAFNSMLDRLHDSFRRLSDLSSDLAHELRTPINSLLGQAQVALSRARSVGEYRDAIELIAEDGERVSRIVRDMLFLARADNASAMVKKERLDLRAELADIVAYFDLLADERGVRIACEGRAEVRADRAMIRRAIGNLLSNALWHTPRGETVYVKIRPADPAAVCLEVSNPGPGIPAEHLPRIFDRFYQVDPPRGDRAGRSGLGLAIVKSIMDLHGGSVEATSPPGGLTTFRLKLDA